MKNERVLVKEHNRRVKAFERARAMMDEEERKEMLHAVFEARLQEDPRRRRRRRSTRPVAVL